MKASGRGLDKKQTLQMRLLTEELFGMMKGIMGIRNDRVEITH